MDNGNEPREVSESFVPLVRAEADVLMKQAGALAVIAGGEASLTMAGAGMMVAGGDVTLNEAGAGTMIVGGNVSVANGGIGKLVSGGGASVVQSRVMVLLTPSANLEDSEVVVGTQQAIAMGAAAGLVLLVLGRLLRRG